ncbi:16S/23S rRNA (cytidine-2'-O)-methyltransferase TlyA [Anaerotruncus sp. 2789STDY5834896]|uniref:16S/23S rRNA (Cytidine-2'-O)-methyltransferase TlyA n=1 Tax=uncultured Anaerotruncus sp. TaxID=905011 RepID=A0A1C6GQ76_9FIRM|nr:16S/23S rRNA (cytidine-2'-O)-methyltransferase TlyA [uncultured Anaerotruncus sp.]
MQKTRLDVYLAQNNLAESRQRAQAYIMAGTVYINGQKADKAGDVVKEGDRVEVRGTALPYVSRGGLKLEKAMACFAIDLQDSVCMDVGASTGGFTDCMLQNGARKVYAIDVGYGQLAWKLRTDERVVNLERQNIRHLTHEQVTEPVDLASIDVSFISLTLVLPVVRDFLAPAGQIVCLIKPQFEAGREKVGKKGVVREQSTHREVIEKVVAFAQTHGFCVKGLTFSPVKGPEGNIEYLLWLQRTEGEVSPFEPDAPAQVVEQSHQALA